MLRRTGAVDPVFAASGLFNVLVHANVSCFAAYFLGPANGKRQAICFTMIEMLSTTVRRSIDYLAHDIKYLHF